MCTSHSVMEGQRHSNPLNPRCFCLQTVQKGWSWLLTHAIVEAAKAVGGSFKLVTLAPKTIKGDDSTAQGNIKEWRRQKGHLVKISPIHQGNLITHLRSFTKRVKVKCATLTGV